MKKAITLVFTLIAINSFSQTIQFQLDTVQVLKDSDAGAIDAADVDNDGDADIIVTGNGATGINTSLYLNDGNGNFSAQSSTVFVNVMSGAAEFVDIDGDSDQDVLITGNTSAPSVTANLYINDGSGNFSLASNTPFEPSNGGDLDFGDVDGDGDPDLIMTGLNASNNPFCKLYLNNGSGGFSEVSNTTFVSVANSSTEFIDIDNDNDLDLLILGENDANKSTTNLYENDGNGAFTLVTNTPFEHLKFGDIAYGDSDNDGDIDLFLVGSDTNGQNQAAFYLNSNSGFSLVSNTPFPGVSLHSTSFADFNHDGNLDLVLIGNSSTGLIGHVYANLGSNNFVLADSNLSGSYNGTHINVDVNGDNKLDIISTGTSFTLPVRNPKIYFNQSPVLSVEKTVTNEVAHIYPNPSNGLVNIELSSNQKTEVEVYNMNGQLILKEEVSETLHQISIDGKAGIYHVVLRSAEGVTTRTIEILH